MEQREKKEKMDKSQLLPSSAHSTFDRNTRHLKVATVCDGNIQLLELSSKSEIDHKS